VLTPGAVMRFLMHEQGKTGSSKAAAALQLLLTPAVMRFLMHEQHYGREGTYSITNRNRAYYGW